MVDKSMHSSSSLAYHCTRQNRFFSGLRLPLNRQFILYDAAQPPFGSDAVCLRIKRKEAARLTTITKRHEPYKRGIMPLYFEPSVTCLSSRTGRNAHIALDAHVHF